MGGRAAARQADGWPPAGKAISLSTLQRKMGGRRARGAVTDPTPAPVLPQTPPGCALALPGTSYRSFRMKGGRDGEGVRGCAQGWLLIRANGGSCFQGMCAELRVDCHAHMAKVQGLGWEVRAREEKSAVSGPGSLKGQAYPGLFPASTPKPSSQVTPVMFLLRCSSGHVWVRVPVTNTTGLPWRNEDGGLPSRVPNPLSETFSPKTPVGLEEGSMAVARL